MTKKAWLLPKPSPLACYACGLRYGGPGWMDAVVSDETWEKISPTGDGGGILCISCMAARCQALGLAEIPIQIASGPFARNAAEHALVVALKRAYQNMDDSLHGRRPTYHAIKLGAEIRAAIAKAEGR